MSRKGSYLFSNTFLGILASWIVILVLTFYPIVNAIPISLGIKNTPFNYLYRFSYLLIGIYIILVRVFVHKVVRLPKNTYIVPFLIFWFLYSLRLIYDLSIINIPTYNDLPSYYFYFYAIGGCLVPSLAIFLVATHVNIKITIKYLYRFLILSNILLLYFFVIDYGANILALSSRPDIGEEGGIGPIYFSRYGAMLIIFATYNTFFTKELRFLHLSFMLIGLITAVIGASRGPIAIGLLFSILLVMLHWKIFNVGLSYYLILCCFILFLVIVLVGFIISSIDFSHIMAYQRFIQAFQSENPRMILYNQGWRQFVESPWFGDRFLLRDIQNGYVHNISIGAFMSVGIVGGFFYLMMLILLGLRTVNLTLRSKQHDYILLIFLTWFWFFMGNISSAIYTLPYLWVLISLGLSIRGS